MAREARSKDELTEALEEVFPRVKGSSEALRPLRNLFYSACPGQEWKVGDLITCFTSSLHSFLSNGTYVIFVYILIGILLIRIIRRILLARFCMQSGCRAFQFNTSLCVACANGMARV